jgi:hypothetical protein
MDLLEMEGEAPIQGASPRVYALAWLGLRFSGYLWSAQFRHFFCIPRGWSSSAGVCGGVRRDTQSMPSRLVRLLSVDSMILFPIGMRGRGEGPPSVHCRPLGRQRRRLCEIPTFHNMIPRFQFFFSIHGSMAAWWPRYLQLFCVCLFQDCRPVPRGDLLLSYVLFRGTSISARRFSG